MLSLSCKTLEKYQTFIQHLHRVVDKQLQIVLPSHPDHPDSEPILEFSKIYLDGIWK